MFTYLGYYENILLIKLSKIEINFIIIMKNQGNKY